MSADQMISVLKNSGKFDPAYVMIGDDDSDTTDDQNKIIICGSDCVEILVLDLNGKIDNKETDSLCSTVISIIGWDRYTARRFPTGGWLLKFIA